MELVHVLMTRKGNMRLLLILVLISICSLIVLISYQLSHSQNYPRTLSGVKKTNYDFHNDEFDQSDAVSSETSRIGKEVEDQMIFESHLLSESNSNSTFGPRSIAIGCAITSHNEEHLSAENVPYKLPFLRTLVPSFCKTASAGYEYHFYASFDMRDPHLGKEEFMEAIYSRFNEITELLCSKKVKAFLHFIRCSHSHNPTWAQNDAMIEAYLDHIEYYYRVNDDTLMLTPGWTEAYIEGLQGFSPPNVGVVGPLHKGGNEAILTYDFVHRSHIDIFGYYYPRVFTDWWADNWITQVYGEMRTLKLPNVRLIHTGEAGTRYEVKQGKQRFLEEQVKEDQETLQRYLKSVEESQSRESSSLKKVVSMSLWGPQTRYTFGALRNAQLMPVYFPEWTLRIYTEKPRADDTTIFNPVPERIIRKLAKLGAEIMRVDAERSRIPPMMWRFLVADDSSVDYFIVRDSDCRLQDRDVIVVADWISSKSPFHCIRDHPSHANYPLLGGLWGGTPRKLHEILPVPWQELMMGVRSDYAQDMTFLASAIWPKVQDYAFCHDSVSCKNWVNSHPFPVARIGTEHLGQVFDAFGNARDEDIQILLENRPPSDCTVQQPKQSDIVQMTNTTVYSRSVISTDLPSFAKGYFLNESKKNEYNLPESVAKEISSDESLVTNSRKESFFSKVDVSRNISAFLNREPNSDTKFVSHQSRNVRSVFDRNVTKNAVRYRSMNQMQSYDSAKSSVHQNTDSAAIVWSMDYSLFPVRAVKHLTSDLGVRFIDKSLAKDCHMTRSCASNLRVITRTNVMKLTNELIRAFYVEYELDPEMDLVTHFLCSNPISLCELYLPFNRSVVIYITSRYEHGKYTASKWMKWNAVLKSLASKPFNQILTGSNYDARYLHYFTGIKATVIPVHCGYMEFKYNPTSNAILLSTTQFPSFDEFFVHKFKHEVRNSHQEFKIVLSSDFGSESHNMSAAAASYLAVIHIPSDAVTKQFCEHYAMHIPILVPTLDLTIAWHFQYGILDKLTWNSVRRLHGEKSAGSPLAPGVGMEGVPDPNDTDNKDSLQYWMMLSAFYQSPHVVYFSSFSDLVEKLGHMDFKESSEKMAKESDRIKMTAAHEWLRVFNVK